MTARPLPVVPLLAFPRTGSNRLQDLLSAQTGVVSVGELADPVMPSLPEYWSSLIVRQHGSWERYRTELDADPVTVLRALVLDHDAEVVVVKVFPGHLSPPALARLIQDSAGVMTLQRNALSAWVSYQDAVRSGRWMGGPDGSEPVDWDPEGFANWADRNLSFLRFADRVVRATERPAFSWTYGTLAACSDPGSLWAALMSAIPALPPLPTDPGWHPTVAKQGTGTPIGRLSDPTTALEELRTFGLGWLATDSDVPSTDLVPLLRAMAEAAREERLDTYVSERESLLQWRSALIEERDQLVAERDALLAASGSDLRELAGLTDDQSALTVEAIKHQRDTALRALADVEGSRVWRMSGPYRRARQTWARRRK